MAPRRQPGSPVEYGQVAAEVEEAYPNYQWTDPMTERVSVSPRPTSVTEGVGTLEERFEGNPYDLPREETATIDQLVSIVTRWAKARAMGREEEAIALEDYLTGGHGFPLSPTLQMQMGIYGEGDPSRAESTYAPARDFLSLTPDERHVFNKAVYNVNSLPTVLLFTVGDADLNQMIREGTAESLRTALDVLTDEEFANFEKEQLDSINLGLYPDLVRVFSNPTMITNLGIFTEKTEVEINDFFDEPGVLGQYAAGDELTSAALIRDSDFGSQTRGQLLFIYKFFQAHPEMSAEDIGGSLIPGEEPGEESELFKDEFEKYLGFLADVDSLAEGGMPRRITDPIMQDLFESLDSDLVREVGKITTSPEWLAGRTSALDQFASVNTVTNGEWSVYLSDVNRETLTGTARENEELLAFVQSNKEEFTKEYAGSGSDLSFREWAVTKLTPGLNMRMVDEQPMNYHEYDKIIDPVIRSMLEGMPSSNAIDARLAIKDLLGGLQGANNITSKKSLLKIYFHKQIRNDWLRTYIATDIIGAHPNGEAINEAIKASGLNVLGVFRGLLSEDVDGVIALDRNSTRTNTQDALFGAFKELSDTVANAIEEPYEGEAMDLERISAYEGVLNPIIAALGIGQIWSRGIKDAYINSIFPASGARLDILQAAEDISEADFGEYAIAYVKDEIGQTFENGEEILDKIQDSYGGDPFAFFKDNDLNSDSIRTRGDLNRRVQDFIVLPDELNVRRDQLIRDQAEFLLEIPEAVQPHVREYLESTIDDLVSEAGISLEDFMKGSPGIRQELRDAGNLVLNALFADDVFRDVMSIGTAKGREQGVGGDGRAPNIIEFLSSNNFSGQTVEQIIETVQDFTLPDPVPGESNERAEARGRIEEFKQRELEDEAIDDFNRQEALKAAGIGEYYEEYAADQERLEEDERLADISREERARQYDFEDPFAKAFEKQANKFLFGAQGRAVAQDVGGLALQEFEDRINVTRDRVETDTGERPSFRQLFSGEFPEVGNIDQYVQREFDVDFFTESARKSRQSRTHAPRVGISQVTTKSRPRLGAVGGR